jgi:hypothetical protein
MTFWQMLWVTIGGVLGFVVIFLLFLAGSKYSVHDTEAHATDYAGTIKEGHGGLTTFLWVMIIGMLIWTIIFFIMHASEFTVISAYAQ